MVLGAEVLVHRNDQISVDEARALKPTHLCISPGPGTPYDAGVSMQMIAAFAGHVPVLGVCLGHQSLVEVFGGKVVRAARLMHGKTSQRASRRPRHSRGSAGAVRGGPLSFADRAAAVVAGRAGSFGAHRRGRDHGRAPSRPRGRRRAVSSGERAHAAGAAADGQLPAATLGKAPGNECSARSSRAAARPPQPERGAGGGPARRAHRSDALARARRRAARRIALRRA